MFFRSEKMKYFEMRVTYDSAWAVLGTLGNLSAVQIEDSNEHLPAMNRPFINYSKRCLALYEKVHFMEAAIRKSQHKLETIDEFGQVITSLVDRKELLSKTGDAYLDQLEADLSQRHTGLKRDSETLAQLEAKLFDLVEQKDVLRLIQPVLPRSFALYSSVGQEVGEEGVRSVGFSYICGVLKSEDVDKFQKLVYRASRGNSFLKLLDIPLQKDEKGRWIHVQLNENGAPVPRMLFFLAFQCGGSGQMLKNRFSRLCDSFSARRYNLPKSSDEIAEELAKIDYDISSLIRIRDSTTEALNQQLDELVGRSKETGCSLFEELKIRVLREKCIYEHFDRMVLRDRIFVAHVWVPEDQEGSVKRVVEEFGKAFNFSPPELEERDWQQLGRVPPSYFKTNDLTKPFLEIVETYGIPRYREANPAPWAISTFPYQFGVMFGDVGHGGLLFAAGSYLVYKYEELKLQRWPKKLLELRYLIFLMGFFAFYCGFVYNELFAVPLKLFSSCHDADTLERQAGCTYPLGMDHAWYSAKNEVSYFNSFKMKLSIIIGVLHMMLGIFVRGSNNVHFGQYIDLVFECVPQVLFMSCTFGYMCVCIVLKWLQDWTDRTPPAILSIYTGMGITVASADPGGLAGALGRPRRRKADELPAEHVR